MDAEEILKALANSNPEIAKAIEALNKVEKKRGRPKKSVEQPPQPKTKNGVLILPNNIKKTGGGKKGEKQKNYTKVEEVDLKKIQKGVNAFEETDQEKENYYKERPLEKSLKYAVRTPRVRGNGLVTKTCEECGDEVEVAPILATASYFRCNDCLINKRTKLE
jgi:hypothetical protein